MTTFAELDTLTTEELHHRATRTAEKRLDVRFFYRLLRFIPVAEVKAGDEGEAEYDVNQFQGWFADFLRRGHRLDDALRPVYIDYLLEHGG